MNISKISQFMKLNYHKNIIQCFTRPETLPACCERAQTKERRYWGEGQQLAKPLRSLLCNFSIKRGDGNAHLHCPQLLQSQDHSPIWSMGRCQHPTPRKGRPVVHQCWQEHLFSFFLEIDRWATGVGSAQRVCRTCSTWLSWKIGSGQIWCVILHLHCLPICCCQGRPSSDYLIS